MIPLRSFPDSKILEDKRKFLSQIEILGGKERKDTSYKIEHETNEFGMFDGEKMERDEEKDGWTKWRTPCLVGLCAMDNAARLFATFSRSISPF